LINLNFFPAIVFTLSTLILQNNSTLKSLIDKLWQSFWEGGIANPLTAIEQIIYLLFMKRLEDLEAKRERDAEFTGEKNISRYYGCYVIEMSLIL
jgi:type I restriction enzyme M protein